MGIIYIERNRINVKLCHPKYRFNVFSDRPNIVDFRLRYYKNMYSLPLLILKDNDEPFCYIISISCIPTSYRKRSRMCVKEVTYLPLQSGEVAWKRPRQATFLFRLISDDSAVVCELPLLNCEVPPTGVPLIRNRTLL